MSEWKPMPVEMTREMIVAVHGEDSPLDDTLREIYAALHAAAPEPPADPRDGEIVALKHDIERHLSICTELATDNERLREALGHYADKSAWTTVVLDSYSGEVDIFDWDGDLGDEPWEMAERALRGESDEVMMSDKTTLEDRVQQFAAMKLPGQPQFMHTGTSYLVNDLWREITRLRELLLAALEESDPYWRVEAHRKLEEDGDE